MTEHTPGPWEARHLRTAVGIFAPGKFRPLATVMPGREAKQADAAVIAAAPDMLAALAVLGIRPHPTERGRWISDRQPSTSFPSAEMAAKGVCDADAITHTLTDGRVDVVPRELGR